MKMKYNNRLWRGALVLAMTTMPSLLFAQKAGDIISGVIEDNDGPMMMVNVTERDAADRIVAHAITDIEGNFSFQLKNHEAYTDAYFIEYHRYCLQLQLFCIRQFVS